MAYKHGTVTILVPGSKAKKLGSTENNVQLRVIFILIPFISQPVSVQSVGTDCSMPDFLPSLPNKLYPTIFTHGVHIRWPSIGAQPISASSTNTCSLDGLFGILVSKGPQAHHKLASFSHSVLQFNYDIHEISHIFDQSKVDLCAGYSFSKGASVFYGYAVILPNSLFSHLLS